MIYPKLLEHIAFLVDKHFKNLLKINQNEYNVCNKINKWIYEIFGCDDTKKIFMKTGNQKILDRSMITPKTIITGMMN